jgi:F0F1-type ATP synthase assembly protein I
MVGHSPWRMIILLLVLGCLAGYFLLIRTDPWQKKAEPVQHPAAAKTVR